MTAAPEPVDASTDTAVDAAADTTPDARRTFVWNRYNALLRARGANDPQVRRMAAAARRASGTQPGTHPDVWPLYRTAYSDGTPIDWEGRAFRAEHLAIALWGHHQQGNARPMHVQGDNLGTACLALFHRRSKKDAPVLADLDDAISRRLKVIARTGDITVAARHIKSLVNFLGSEAIPVDYTNLYFALVNWDDEDKHGRDLRLWASSYQRINKPTGDKPAAATTQKD